MDPFDNTIFRSIRFEIVGAPIDTFRDRRRSDRYVSISPALRSIRFEVAHIAFSFSMAIDRYWNRRRCNVRCDSRWPSTTDGCATSSHLSFVAEMSERVNVVRDYGASQSHCVYCRQSSRFCTHGMLSPALDHRTLSFSGMMTSTLTVQAYQDLVDIGWTRAGYYMYKVM